MAGGGFDAGKITATATLDRTPFQAELARAREEGRKFASEKFTPNVSADTREGDAKVLDFQRKLSGVGRSTTTAKVSADTAAASAKLKPLTEQLAQIRDRVNTARVRLDGNDRALYQLDSLKISLDAIDKRLARPRVSLAGADAAEIALDRLALKLKAVGALTARPGVGGGRGGTGGILSSLGSHAPGFGLRNLALAASPIAVPLAGAALGGAASFLTPTVAGGLAGGLFAKTAQSTYKGLTTTVQTLTADQAALASATTATGRAAALAQKRLDWRSLSKPQQDAVKSMRGLDSAWTSFQHKLQPQSFKLLSTGADIGAKALHLMLPATKAAGNAIDSLATSADHALSQPFWQNFFTKFLPGQAHSAITTLGTDLGHVGTGVANLVEKFAPLGTTLEHDSRRWTKSFEGWTQGQGPGKFVNWVQQNGPGIVHDLGGIAHGVEGIGKGLMPIGQIELKAFGGILNFIGNLADEHPAVLTALGTAYLSIAGGLKAISLVSGISSTATAVKTLVTAMKEGQGLKSLPSLLGKGGVCGCGPGGVPLGGPVGTVERDATVAGEGAIGGAASKGVVARTLARFGITAGEAGGAGIVGAGAGISVLPATLIAIATANWLSKNLPHPDSNLTRSGIFAGQDPQDVQKFPLTSLLYSNLFAKTKSRLGPLTAYSPIADPSTPSGFNVGAMVKEIAKTNAPGELAELVRLGKQFPVLRANLLKFDSALTVHQRSELQAAAATAHLSGAYSNMSATARIVGSKLTGVSTGAEANRRAFKGAATNLKQYADYLVSTGLPLDQVRQKVAAQARSLEQNATAIYGNKKEVDRLLRSWGAMPHQVRTQINVEGIQAALVQLHALQGAIASVSGPHSGSVSLSLPGGHRLQHPGGSSGLATGGRVHGPGTGTSDSVPAWLSNGEYVVNARSTSRHLELLHAINAGHFASGGHATKPGTSSSSTTSSTKSSGPSKATIANALASIAQFAGLTFVNDLEGTAKTIKSGITQMIDRLNNAVRNHYLAGDKKLVTALKGSQKTLVNLANTEDQVSKSLTAAQSRLSSLRSDASQVRSSAVGSFLGLGDLTQASSTTTLGGLLSVDSQQVKVAKSFHRNLETLRKKGLSRDEYRTLEAAGPGAAGNIVGLLATANKSQIGQFNHDESILHTLGISTGKASANYLDGQRIKDARKEVARLRSEEHKLRQDQHRAALAMEKLVKAGLQDKGTHAALATLHKDNAEIKQLLRHIGKLPGQAKQNHRTHVPGVHS